MITKLIQKWKNRKGTWKTIWFDDGYVDIYRCGFHMGKEPARIILKYNDKSKEARAFKIIKAEQHECEVSELCMASKEARNICDEFMIPW